MPSLLRTSALTVMSLSLLVSAALAADSVALSVDHRFESERLASRGGVDITFAEIDVYLQRVPKEERQALLANYDRLATILQNLFLPALLHQRARESGLFEEVENLRPQLYSASLSMVANVYLERYVTSQLLDDYEQRARELWLTRPEDFRSAETVDFTQVFVDSGLRRGEVEAMRRTLAVYDELQQGAELPELVSEFSDDPAAERNAGVYREIPIDQLDEAVARGLAGLEPGQMAQPVRSEAGWHILRLDARHPRENLEWEEAREQAIDRARAQHQSRLVDQLYRELLSDPLELAPGALPALLARYDVESAEPLDEEALREAASDPEL